MSCWKKVLLIYISLFQVTFAELPNCTQIVQIHSEQFHAIRNVYQHVDFLFWLTVFGHGELSSFHWAFYCSGSGSYAKTHISSFVIVWLKTSSCLSNMSVCTVQPSFVFLHRWALWDHFGTSFPRSLIKFSEQFPYQCCSLFLLWISWSVTNLHTQFD